MVLRLLHTTEGEAFPIHRTDDKRKRHISDKIFFVKEVKDIQHSTGLNSLSEALGRILFSQQINMIMKYRKRTVCFNSVTN